jgi:flavorubredoxin
MIDATEIARRIYRIGVWNDPCLAGLSFPDTSYNMFLVAADRPAIINTLFRRSFTAVRAKVAEIVDPSSLRYVVVPHHEGDSSGAINEWLAAAPNAAAVCSELCALLSLRDFAAREPMVVGDGQTLDLGSHRLRLLMTPQVNQWDSLMVHEETTGTLFSNDLFSMPGTEISTDRDISTECLDSTREVGYQPDDRFRLLAALDKIGRLRLEAIAVMHGPVIRRHFAELIHAFRNNLLGSAPSQRRAPH